MRINSYLLLRKKFKFIIIIIYQIYEIKEEEEAESMELGKRKELQNACIIYKTIYKKKKKKNRAFMYICLPLDIIKKS